MAAVPPDLVKVQISFDLIDGSTPTDTAVTGFYVLRHHRSGNPTDWPFDTTALANLVRTLWIAEISPTLFSSNVRGQVVKAYHLDTNGHALDEGVAPFDPTDFPWQGSAPQSMPWETSIVLSTYGFGAGQFVQDRARKRGRMYLPPGGTNQVAGAGLLSGPSQSQLVSDFSNFLNGVQGAEINGGSAGVDDYWSLVIFSRTGGYTTQMERFDIGNVFDVQRRRRNRQVEARVGDNIDHT
uniref:Uncharacterized protein n=1 Tax=uncultured prokaryote TaxID=198431 RepID=A0A0H5Q2E4_9ZZZZ|nr:hypothetical protein [uncultured prokaryote]